MSPQLSSESRASTRRVRWGAVGLAAGLLAVLGARYWGFVVDDVYIPLRYAQNLLAGHGLVFNVGERVEGFTNLTWTLLGAGILRVGLEPIITLKIVGLICALLTTWVCLLILEYYEPERPGLAWLVSFLIAGAPCIVVWAVSGMETILFALLLAGTFYVYLVGKSWRGWPLWPIVAAVATMTRPEGLLIVPILLGHGWLVGSADQRRQTQRALLTIVVILGAFVLWRFSYYGDVVPNTYYAKAAGGGWRAGLGGARYLLEFARSYCGPVAIGLLGAALVLTDRGKSAALLVVTVAAYFLTPLKLGSDWMPQFRYLAPYWPLAAVLVVIGTARLGDLIATQTTGHQHRTQLAVSSFVLCAFVLMYGYQVVLAYNPGGKHYGHYGISVDYHSNAVKKYAGAGKRLAQIAQPGDTLAAFAVGAIGYYCDIYIIDVCGLVSKTTARQSWPERLQYVLGERPTYIEDFSNEASSSGLTSLPEFQQNYVPLGDGPIDRAIFVRKDLDRSGGPGGP